jgi:hypothetical protein
MTESNRMPEGPELAEDDGALLATREAEVEDRALPRVVDGARRATLLCDDPLATTWRAWDQATGEPLLIRLIRVRWRHDAVMLRRMARGASAAPVAPEILRPTWRPDGDWPHLRIALPGPLLDDLVLAGASDPLPDPAEVARLLGGAVVAAGALERSGRANRAEAARHLVYTPDGIRVPWLDPFCPAPVPSALLATATISGRALDPTARTPAAEALQGLVDRPGSATMDEAAALLHRALANHLMAARHDLVRQGRRTAEGSRATRLGRAVRRLIRSMAPPPVHACVRADTDGTLAIAWSDGSAVRGGTAAETRSDPLPLLWTAEDGLDPIATRALLRAWNQRDRGDSTRQAKVNRTLGASPEQAAALMGWLSGQSRLRRADRLLRVWASGALRL